MKTIITERGKWGIETFRVSSLTAADMYHISQCVSNGHRQGEIIHTEEVPDTHFEIEAYLDDLFREDPWVQDPRFPLEDWQFAVDNGDTRQSYRGWLYNQYSNLE